MSVETRGASAEGVGAPRGRPPEAQLNRTPFVGGEGGAGLHASAPALSFASNDAMPGILRAAQSFCTHEGSTMTQSSPNGNITGILADYMAQARDRALPPDVDREAKHRLLDSLAAIVSGSTLLPGQMAAKYVRTLGGVPESMVMTTDIVTSAANAGPCQRHDGPRRRDRRLRPTFQGAPRLQRRARGMGHGRARRRVRDGDAPRRGAGVRRRLPDAAGGGRGQAAGGAPQRRRLRRNVRGDGRGGVSGAPRRDADALRALLRGAAGVRPLGVGGR